MTDLLLESRMVSLRRFVFGDDLRGDKQTTQDFFERFWNEKQQPTHISARLPIKAFLEVDMNIPFII